MSRYPGIGEQMNAPPPSRGLYDPRFDHDACGVAFVARIAGGASHEVVASGIDALERRLYVLRRVIEARAAAAGYARSSFHWASLSSRTLIYKGMLTAAQLAAFYPDLRETDAASCLALVHARFSTNVLPRWDLA